MTLVKNKVNLREMFAKLPKSEQDAVINFFNLHNAAIWIYNFLTDDAKAYTNVAINFSQSLQEADVVSEEENTEVKNNF